MLVKYKYQTHSNCPRCGATQEKTNHVLQCTKGEGVQALWNAELEQLKEWMDQNKFHSELTEAVLTNLHHWRDNTVSSYQPSNLILQKALEEQEKIGWDSSIEGF